MKRKWNNLILIAVSLIFLGRALIFPGPSAASKPFPVYPAIKPNVAFWKKVYTTTQPGIKSSVFV